MKCTILFDLDGTLIDSTEAILESFAKAYEHFGEKAPPEDAIKALIGHPLSFMFAHLGVRGDVERYVQAYKHFYRQVFRQKTRLLPHAREAIEEAAAFARLGIVTTKTGRYSKELLDHLGLLHHFEVVIGSEDVTHHKPHPQPILKALHHMRAQPQESFMVGDTCLDMEAAHGAGVVGVGVSCGYGESKHLRRCTDHLFADALEGVRFIKRICQ